MFLIEKDSVNISMMNGVLNIMSYFLRESNVESDKDKKMYSLGLPTNSFATDRDDFEKYLKTVTNASIAVANFCIKMYVEGSQSDVYDFQYRVPKPLNVSEIIRSYYRQPIFHVLATTCLSFSMHKYENCFRPQTKDLGSGT